MVNAETVGVALAGVGLAGTAIGWVVRAYVQSEVSPIAALLDKHQAEDALIHEHVKESLVELNETTKGIDAKLDRLMVLNRNR